MPVDYNYYVKDNKTGCWNYISSSNNRKTYTLITRIIDGKRISKLAHRYFYEKYKGKIEDGMVIDHLCRNKCCVNPEHLEQVTPIENIRRGKSAKVNLEKIKKIDKLYKDGYRQIDIAKIFNINQSEVSRILNGLRWPEITMCQ